MEINDKIINEGYTNINGIYFPNLREIALKSKEGQGLRLGKPIASSREIDDSSYSDNGVYINQSDLDPTRAFRIYRDFPNKHFNGDKDDFLISKLQEKQKYITKTTFPYGIVTLDGRIIGQETKLYDPLTNSTLLEYIYELNGILKFDSYLKIIEILKELEENEVYYYDIHPENFVINKITKEINIIDYNNSLMSIGQGFNESKRIILSNLKSMILKLNKDIKTDKNKFIETSWSSLEEAKENIYEFTLKKIV